MAKMATSETLNETEEGTEYKKVGGRAVFPTPEHEFGGGVDVTPEMFDQIIASPDGGETDDGKTSWEWTGEAAETRVGESKVIDVSRECFGRVRTVTLTLVDLADVDLAIRN